ncbi:hypothetical protein KKG58_02100 [Patescibacteria group bacterium]|nr:hypothetical protein [Patescibacteria group bacterium]
MNPELKTIFKNSWNFVWHHPFLWLFGFFAAFFTNNEIHLIIANFQRINKWVDQLIIFKSLQIQFQNLLNTFTPLQFLNIKTNYHLIFAIIIALLFFYLSFLSQISIILSVKNRHFKKILSLNKIWKKSKKFLWPIVGIYLIIFLLIYSFLFLLGLSFFYQVSIPFIVYVLLFIILGFLVSFISRFAICFIVLEKKKFFNAIKMGSIFFFKNWLATIKISIYFCLITILIGLGLFLVSIGTAVPFLILVDLFLRLNFVVGFWLILIFWTILILVFFLLSSSIFSAWQFSVWTSFFVQHHNSSEKKLEKM